MAAVSQWPAAAGHHGSAFSSNTQVHEVRNNDIPAGGANNDDSSDAYSFEARNDASGAGDAAPASSSTPSGEAVRPDSLALTSPLEQLTRSLSFNKKDNLHGSTTSAQRSTTRARYPQDCHIAIPPVEQVMLEYLATEPTHEVSASTPNLPFANASNAKQNHRAATTTDALYQPQMRERFELEATLSSDDTTRTGDTEDASEGQGQLINAFRSSYHTYMTRSGGLRDSSYSWMGPDADSPNVTLDFKQAESGQQQDKSRADALLDSDRYEDPQDGKDTEDIIYDEYGQWDAESKAKARASSWDSQAAKKMSLHRIPSQKKSETPTDARASDVSAFEPFHYSSYESALQASKEAKQKSDMRASNWTGLTDTTLPQDGSAAVQPLSTVDEGGRSPSLYAYAVDSPSMMQGAFAGPSRVASAIPIPQRTMNQAVRTNFSRPHDTLTSVPSAEDHSAAYAVEQLSHVANSPQSVSQLPYAGTDQGHDHPSRQPYDSVYSAYTQTNDYRTPLAPHPAPFQGGIASRPEYSPSSSSPTTYTIQDMNTSTRPNLQSIESYTGSLRNVVADSTPAEPTQSKRHRRTPSQVLASAIAKHRGQRAAAGLTTEGQYYVDPKSKKYYFVADSGQAGGSALAKTRTKDGKENEKPKERRKLYKKEAGWEITKVNQSKATNTASPPKTPQQDERDRSLSLSGRSAGSGRTSEEGNGSGSKWKIWSSGRSHGSKENLPLASPSLTAAKHREQGNHLPEDSADSSFELIAEVRALTSSAKNSSSPGTRHHGIFGGHPSPKAEDPSAQYASHRSPTPSSRDHTHEGTLPYLSQGASSSQGHGAYSTTSHLQPPTAFYGHSSDPRPPPGMKRSNSVYSNYSYYEMPTDQGYVSSTRASPVMDRSQSGNRSEGSSHMPMQSPYIARTDAQPQPSGSSHSRQPSTTLDKAKFSMNRSESLQLLAPAKHQNLTVPKGDAGNKLDLAELARTNPNDPLVCLHLGIDAHERGNLEESATLFEKSANGGCGLGMLMYGLSLRHGWGCVSDPEAGFRYLQRAAESVVENLDRVISGHIQLSEQQMEEQAAKSELVLSIYELGQCFLRGWGVAKDKKTALQYFILAANLGDPDAQSELGFCYSTGRGCKKDLKIAAKYYRMAAKQGQITYGMQWIFKSKYDH